MEKKYLYGIIILLLLIFLGYILFDYFYSPTDSITYSDEITKEDKLCERNEDCKILHLGCCYIHGKYSNHNLVAVNETGKQKIEEWKQDNCVACMTQNEQLMYDDVITKQFCEETQCQIKKLSCEQICNTEENQSMEEDLDKVGMTKEQALQSCGC